MSALPEWACTVADWLPVFVLLALIMTAAVTWLLCGDRARRLAAIVRHQDELIAVLERQLAESDEVIDRISGGTAEILAAVRGAHHREEGTR